MSNFVGCCETTIVDEHKDLTFPMLAMYPTYIPSKPVTFGPYSLDVSIDAPVEDGSFPLVMISHGSGGSNLAYRTLGMHLAKNGFVVCLPEHPFNNRNNNALEGSIENMIDRPRHISLAINNILSNDRFKKFLQMDNVAVTGHSMGGYTALALRVCSISRSRDAAQGKSDRKSGVYPKYMSILRALLTPRCALQRDIE